MVSFFTSKIAKIALTLVLVFSSVGSMASKAGATEIDFSTYAAIAFSQSTGEIGYAWDHNTRWSAEQAALRNCAPADAKIVGWVQGGWLVLAVGTDNAYGVGWEYGDGASNVQAANTAKNECHKRGQRVKKLVILCSGDIDPQIIK